MIHSHELLYDYQINDWNILTKLLDLTPLPFLASINLKSSKINIWKTTNLTIFSILKGHLGTVSDISFVPFPQILISSGYDATVKFWNPLTAQCLVTLKLQDYRRIKLTLSNDSTLFIMEGAKKIVNNYPILKSCDIYERRFKDLKNSGTHQTFIKDFIVLSPKTKRIAYALEKNIVIFNYELEFIVKTLKEEDKFSVTTIQHFTREPLKVENEFIISSNTGNCLKIWNVFKAQVVIRIQMHQNLGEICQIQMIQKFDFKLAIVATSYGEILIININERKLEYEITDFSEEGSAIWSLLYLSEKNKHYSVSFSFDRKVLDL